MNITFTNKKDRIIRLLRRVVAVFLVLMALALIIPQAMRISWAGTIYPNVYIGDVDFGGKTFKEAHTLLQKSWDTIHTEGIEVLYDNERIVLYPLVTAPGDPDLSYEVITLETEQTMNRLISIGRDASLWQLILQPYISLYYTYNVSAEVTIDRNAIEQIIRDSYGSHEQPAQDARFNIKGTSVSIVPEQTGTVIDIDKAVVDINSQLQSLQSNSIALSKITEFPLVTEADIAPLSKDATELLERVPFTFTVRFTEDNGRVFWWQDTATSTMVASWLTTTKASNGTLLTFNTNLDKYLNKVAEDVYREPRDAKFDISETTKRITQFQYSRNGLRLNIPETRQKFIRDLITNKQTRSELVLDLIEPNITTEATNDLGIKELLGTGTSDFSGSPRNRRINIKVASDKLNGLLIAPGEEFSLVTALKPFTQSSGYVPELVIKGNKLIPEIGGGACQIGTTLFRSTLDAGLDITQRQNHSFAVSYYNDENGLPGTDATIYDPAPDYRFKNDTENYILIQTHVGEDDILTYELWGTNDGRIASTTDPVILSTSPAPKTAYIETEDIEPGETDCSGGNVPGYHTTFNYSVTYTDGTAHSEDFESRYRPFQRVCLVGVEKDSEDIIDEGSKE